MDEAHVPAPAIVPPFIPDQIIIYGVLLSPQNPGGAVQITLEAALMLEIRILSGNILLNPGANHLIVAAYGYAFEGQCYRLDKTKVLAFPAVPTRRAKGCGYDKLGYSMWKVRPRVWVMELDVSIGDFEKLILEASLPGKRPPNTYASHWQVGGRRVP